MFGNEKGVSGVIELVAITIFILTLMLGGSKAKEDAAKQCELTQTQTEEVEQVGHSN